jgi:hypothetical protein
LSKTLTFVCSLIFDRDLGHTRSHVHLVSSFRDDDDEESAVIRYLIAT